MSATTFSAKVINVDAAKGPYQWRYSILMEDADGNLFVWTTTKATGSPLTEGEHVLMTTGEVKSVINLHGNRTLTRVTKCKGLKVMYGDPRFPVGKV